MQYLNDKSVAGIMELGKEQAEQGMPPYWGTYFTVDDVDAACEVAATLGGQVIAEPFDVDVNGRMAVVADPGGAYFNLWQPLKHIGAELVNEPGTIIWNELLTDDAEKIAQFYAALFEVDLEDMEGMAGYKLLHVGDKNVAGIMNKPAEMKDAPSHWGLYFAVADTDKSAEKVKSLGGDVMFPPFDTPMGRVAVIKDPQGAMFQIISYSG
jgi:predicted enzyme related to lactoylglutathione lyase